MDDVLLTKYLLNETSGEEARAVRKWIAAHPDNGRHYSSMLLVWETSKLIGAECEIDEEAAWKRFMEDTNDPGHTRQISVKTLIRKLGWVRVAAMLVMGLFTAFLGYYLIVVDSDGNRFGAVYKTADAVNTDTLADGSVITLNKHASLRFSQGLFGQKRAVELRSGSVFFEVAPDRDKPFVIQSGHVTVTVLGTSFHVARNGDETTVIVESGKVKVVGLDKAVELEARQKVTINTATRHFDERKVIGVLNHTPLWRIAEMLEDAYHVEISIGNDGIRDLPMTTTLHQGTLDETLHIITETLGITATRQGNGVVFK